MRAEILSIGTELLLGSITDTNATYLAQRLAARGIDCFYVSQVGDNEQRIVDTLQRAWERSDLVITTGGLGPTADDLTRESVAAMLGETLHVVPDLEKKLRAFFNGRGLSMPESNLKQASLIPSASSLPNPVGTAPGWLVRRETGAGTRLIVSMPGVPYEMKLMWEQEVEPLLRSLSHTLIVSRTLKILGLGESAIDQAVADLLRGNNPTVAPYAKQDGVHLRITAKAESEAQGRAMIAPVEEEVRARLGDAVYGADDDTPSGVLQQLLAEARLRITALEIGKGAAGALSAQLAAYPGMIATLAFHDLEGVGNYLQLGPEKVTLADAAAALLVRHRADLVVVAQVLLREARGGLSVRADVELLLTASEDIGAGDIVHTNSTWNTTVSEVPRLAGLAGVTLLRRWLIANRREVGQAHVTG